MVRYARRGNKRRRIIKRRKRLFRRTRGRGKLVPLIRRTLFRLAEGKDKAYAWDKAELYHNVPQVVAVPNSADNLRMPMEGNGDDERNGDKIYARGFKVRMLFGHKSDRPNITWRVIAGVVPRDYVYSYNTFFTATTNNSLLDEVNKDLVTVLYQKYMKPSQSTFFGASTFKEYTFARRFFIRRKKMYKFQTNGSAVHDDRQILLVVVPYDAFGTMASDNIGYVQTYTNFLYKDP